VVVVVIVFVIFFQGGSGLVVVNNIPSLGDLPAGNLRTDDLTIPAIM